MSKFELEEEYEFDFFLLGISSHEKDYRICWAINNILEISLEKEDRDIEVSVKKSNRTSLHSMYTFYDDNQETIYRLIANRSNLGFLVPESPQADYFLHISDGYHLDFEKISTLINHIPFVLTTFKIDPESLKSKKNLIF